MIKVGILGAAGYTGGELIRLLIHHPEVKIEFAHSKSNAGKKIYDVHSDLLGDTNQIFDSEYHANIDVLFLCVGHGEAKKFFHENENFIISLNETTKIIDLSTDFRHHENADFYIKNKRIQFIYGLPELNRDKIKSGNFHIANPGCFATCIQLGLLPLAHHNLLNGEITVHALTGSTGAGQQPTSTTHFSWRANNISVYKAFEHQHLKEITESLLQLQPNFSYPINFIPFRGDFTRGIFATILVDTNMSLQDAKNVYLNYYREHPFTFVTQTNPDLKQIVNTNKCFIYLEKHGHKLMIISMIDNLLKGASGQAVQNMNLLFGFSENLGLNLKSIAY
jgi:N-acetyl-gamma-glutamyl-phosphate reductase